MKNTFNAATTGQSLDVSYEILKECAKDNKIKEVYLELYYVINQENSYKEREVGFLYNYTDYMKPSIDKYIYLLQATSKEYYANSFLIPRRNIDDLQINNMLEIA